MGALPFLPGRLRAWIRGHAIGACLYDPGDPRPEAATDGAKRLKAALIFDRVMKERRDGGVFIASPFEHGRTHGQEMSDVGDVIALPPLVPVQALGINQR